MKVKEVEVKITSKEFIYVDLLKDDMYRVCYTTAHKDMAQRIMAVMNPDSVENQ